MCPGEQKIWFRLISSGFDGIQEQLCHPYRPHSIDPSGFSTLLSGMQLDALTSTSFVSHNVDLTFKRRLW
jgi:hypothetical protein